jgi:transposase
MKQAQKKYTLEFKEEAIKLVEEQGYRQAEAAARLGICPKNLSRWIHTQRLREQETGKPVQRRIETQELQQLKKENKRLHLEREILKKAAAFFARENR